mmetsp:Transcript_18952/g.52864  ORF Transcript_18952/g.52864 Transcript_18952/m.52864 type:complete len:800 (-) Transcript_18952:678-3077(-)|eukprot:CAMPEP_0117657916 /NCGR_PEP_ID=MMETSP0804-20121206/5584_1 /TAXON_ID=1074897 /ORGANISM="Tetraselmis astigmatica, Strain CCMP880" /LENGTH=799 /DNA_ID=CAMNT_0005464399 /DNA_START=131 /DNA_END=2530 /DNA_ORIENTATION=+
MVSESAKRRAAAKKTAADARRGAQKQDAGMQNTGSSAGSASQNQEEDAAPYTGILLPPTLSARQRAAVHQAADEAGIPHESTGDGNDRRLTLGSKDNLYTFPADQELMDDQLAVEVQQRMRLDIRSAFLSSSISAADAPPRPISTKAAREGAAQKRVMSLEEFVAMTVPLLEAEKMSEVEEARQSLAAAGSSAAASRGRALLNLRCHDVEGGLMGRSLITLVSNKGGGTLQSEPLAPHKFSPHDVVALRPNKGEPSCDALAEGLVYRVKDGSIIVAVDELPEEGLDAPLRLEKLANEVTYKRYQETLRKLTVAGSKTAGDGSSRLADVVFGHATPEFVPGNASWQPFNKGLDGSQKRAVSLALRAKDIALIHGPPGTGKTTTLIETILQEVKRGSRVLVCSASNIAVDNVVERLVKASPKLRTVRMGHPARLLPAVLNASLEAHVLRSDNSAIARDCRNDIKKANSALMKLGRKDYQERRTIRRELRDLVKEERQRQAKAVQEVISGAQVICCTLTGVQVRDLRNESFDVTIIDEAAQALEVACWGALLVSKRAVLAGDHFQLPPTVTNKTAEKGGLGRTLFERLQGMYGGSISEMLTVQYRMNEGIMQWSSNELYEGRLTAAPAVSGHTLAGLAVAASDIPVLLLVDTTGCDCDEQAEEEGDSRQNPGEAKIVLSHAASLVAAGVKAADIGVITPYNGQVALLKQLRPDGLASMEVATVDGFQGREKEAIIISAVRSNETGEVGFLSEIRRMNVAVTRGRRHVCLICCTETLQSNPFLHRLTDYFETYGEYRSGQEFL